MPDIHLPVGTSSVNRLINCPASLSRSKLAPKGNTSKAAENGTRLHTVMENIYEHDMTPEEQLGSEGDNGIVFTETMLEDEVQPAIAATEKLLDMVDADELVNEQFVQYEEGLVGGTLDMIAVSADQTTILFNDFKFGFNAVHPKNNSQILLAALAASVDPETKHLFEKAEKFIGAITQPKVYGEESPTWEFTHVELIDFEAKLQTALDLSEGENPPAKTGSHCMYCPAAPFCDEKKLLARSSLLLSPAQADDLVKGLAVADELEAWLKEIRKTAHDLLEKGAVVDGWKLVQKRASRVWVNKEEVEDQIRKAKTIKLEDGFEMKLKSPAQMEKVCKTIGYSFKKFEGNIASISSGTTLAIESDKRPAVGRAVISEDVKNFINN